MRARVGVLMGGQHELRVLDPLVVDLADGLAHELDRRTLVGEDLGDRGEHAGTVDDVEGDVVAGGDGRDRRTLRSG